VDIDSAIRTYLDLLNGRPGPLMGGWLELLGERLKEKGYPVSEVDHEDDPEASCSLDVYTKEGPSRHESPYVEIILTLPTRWSGREIPRALTRGRTSCWRLSRLTGPSASLSRPIPLTATRWVNGQPTPMSLSGGWKPCRLKGSWTSWRGRWKA
jgi:hypothetical protein